MVKKLFTDLFNMVKSKPLIKVVRANQGFFMAQIGKLSGWGVPAVILGKNPSF